MQLWRILLYKSVPDDFKQPLPVNAVIDFLVPSWKGVFCDVDYENDACLMITCPSAKKLAFMLNN